ncbi:L,D-transpeptidase [Paracoccus marinaquae]|uniref:L,D-transpeptidase n=1 Tax=Paracoccus marinaquae TaxID=2841926 RepID=A0ABS6ANN7_9RHOB|nr:L,D-transpeptidase [Paracoccus marinaquae]MBU3032104.1 L,D-transpeptidase [Paracoccus marinaquae]
MTEHGKNPLDRRGFLMAGVSGAIALASPTLLRAEEASVVRRNMSSFRLHAWQDHFDSLGKGILLSDTNTRVLQHWTADGEMRIYPTSVPLSDELTRRGYTEVVFKDEAPNWAPTPSMIERDPTLPRYVAPGPDNPLGIRAMHLSWQYYRIHGTNDTRKIGRKSSNGCIGLYNEQIVEVFDRSPVGTQVKLI